MKEFNYQDYLKYLELKRKERNDIYKLNESDTKYRVHQPHDKILKTILNEKIQVVELLNRILQLEKSLKEKDIEKYKCEHIDYMFQNSESDVVYRMKEKEIFFLIEHQQKIDYNMPKRILEYEVEIIKEAVKGKIMTKKHHTLPRVIPIVIYTGSRKWNVEKYIEECQETLSEANRIKLGEYYVVDVNDYTKEELEKDKLFLSKILLLEKLKTKEEIYTMLNKTIEEEKSENNRILLKRIIIFILEEKLKPEDRKILLKKLEEGGGKDMVLEVIRKENEKLIREGMKVGKRVGKKEEKIKTVIRMIKRNMTEKDIKEVTEISNKELEEIKEKIIESQNREKKLS